MEKRLDYANTIHCVRMRVSECVHASDCVSIGPCIPYFNFQSSQPILTKFEKNVMGNPDVIFLFSFLVSNNKMYK